ncbi:MAG: DeoR family transcriptional regulator, partial [Bacteroidaceae bacterium]|nr:DeoR family transcriptional regulator [Bacteroidaceae bacterium]
PWNISSIIFLVKATWCCTRLPYSDVSKFLPLPSLRHLKRLILIMGRIGNHDTQDGTQGVTQEDTLDEKIDKAIKDNLNITTEELAKQFGVTSMTIKRHLAKMPHIRYVGSVYSGHWEVLDQE